MLSVTRHRQTHTDNTSRLRATKNEALVSQTLAASYLAANCRITHCQEQYLNNLLDEGLDQYPNLLYKQGTESNTFLMIPSPEIPPLSAPSPALLPVSPTLNPLCCRCNFLLYNLCLKSQRLNPLKQSQPFMQLKNHLSAPNKFSHSSPSFNPSIDLVYLRTSITYRYPCHQAA